jgi:hypothetical protein
MKNHGDVKTEFAGEALAHNGVFSPQSALADRTVENSPAIHRWERAEFSTKSVERKTENRYRAAAFNRPLRGLVELLVVQIIFVATN